VALRRQEREAALETRLSAIEAALAKLGGKAAARPRLARS
jgi:BMFP domain-containing protein YqiC